MPSLEGQHRSTEPPFWVPKRWGQAVPNLRFRDRLIGRAMAEQGRYLPSQCDANVRSDIPIAQSCHSASRQYLTSR